MRTETIEIKIYKYEELEGSAKDRAREWLTDLSMFDYVFIEAFQSIEEFSKFFPVEIRNIDFLETYRSDYRIRVEDQILGLSGLRLRTYLINNFGSVLWRPKFIGNIKNPTKHKRIRIKEGSQFYPYYSACQIEKQNCNLTGVCYDESLLDPFYKFIKKPDNSDLSDLIRDGIEGLCKDVQNEIEARFEEEALIEQCNANGYEFDENGSII